MMRPFYKSMTLWLGLPGFLFLVWAWWDSTKFLDDLCVDTGGMEAHFCSDSNGVTLLLRKRGNPGASATRPTYWGGTVRVADRILAVREDTLREATTPRLDIIATYWTKDSWLPEIGAPKRFVLLRIPDGLHWWSGTSLGTLVTLVLPHYVLILIYLMAWAGAFAWRARRRRVAAVSFGEPRRGTRR